MSAHAIARLQQRTLPPLAIDWLHRFCHEHHDGRGGVILHFNKLARRRLERAVGCEPVRRMKDWLNAYAVLTTDGQLITAGHRFKRILRH